jgi:hypothetical protein
MSDLLISPALDSLDLSFAKVEFLLDDSVAVSGQPG